MPSEHAMRESKIFPHSVSISNTGRTLVCRGSVLTALFRPYPHGDHSVLGARSRQKDLNAHHLRVGLDQATTGIGRYGLLWNALIYDSLGDLGREGGGEAHVIAHLALCQSPLFFCWHANVWNPLK